MKFAKKCGIMVDVNKRVVVCLYGVVQLYNMHKIARGFFVKTRKRKENIIYV